MIGGQFALAVNVPFAEKAMNVDLAPDAPFGTAMLARVPLAFAFTLDLDSGAMQGAIGDVGLKAVARRFR